MTVNLDIILEATETFCLEPSLFSYASLKLIHSVYYRVKGDTRYTFSRSKV